MCLEVDRHGRALEMPSCGVVDRCPLEERAFAGEEVACGERKAVQTRERGEGRGERIAWGWRESDQAEGGGEEDGMHDSF